MQWDTVECGSVTLTDGRFVDGAGRLVDAQAVYRALCDGRWHVSKSLLAITPAHNVGAPARYSWQHRPLWYRAGYAHREDGPAIDGIGWWLHGHVHRIEGEALFSVAWFVEGRRIEARTWQRRARRLRWLLPPQHK